MPEAKLVDGGQGLAPVDEGWFIVNVGAARWHRSDWLGDYCSFEGGSFTAKGPRFAQVGINIRVLAPGQPASKYHAESAEEDFLVLAGECLVLIDGRERRLGAWDFVHCPPGTDHAFIGAGDGPCAILMVGARMADKSINYPLSELALRHGVGVAKETSSPAEAYAGMKLPAAMRAEAWPPRTRRKTNGKPRGGATRKAKAGTDARKAEKKKLAKRARGR